MVDQFNLVNPNELNPDTSPTPLVIGEVNDSPDDSDADDVMSETSGS